MLLRCILKILKELICVRSTAVDWATRYINLQVFSRDDFKDMFVYLLLCFAVVMLTHGLWMCDTCCWYVPMGMYSHLINIMYSHLINIINLLNIHNCYVL